jgi:hypothetical protein
MNLAITLKTETLPRCRELGDATGPLLEGEVLMTTEQYEAWKLEPEQVAKLQELEAQAQALREAEEQARLAEAEAEKEAVIQSFMADGLPRSVAEYYYNALPKS